MVRRILATAFVCLFAAVLTLGYFWSHASATTEVAGLDCANVLNMYRAGSYTSPGGAIEVFTPATDNINPFGVPTGPCLYITDFQANANAGACQTGCGNVTISWSRNGTIPLLAMGFNHTGGALQTAMSDHFNTGYVLVPTDTLVVMIAGGPPFGLVTYELSVTGFYGS